MYEMWNLGQCLFIYFCLQISDCLDQHFIKKTILSPFALLASQLTIFMLIYLWIIYLFQLCIYCSTCTRLFWLMYLYIWPIQADWLLPLSFVFNTVLVILVLLPFREKFQISLPISTKQFFWDCDRNCIKTVHLLGRELTYLRFWVFWSVDMLCLSIYLCFIIFFLSIL